MQIEFVDIISSLLLRIIKTPLDDFDKNLIVFPVILAGFINSLTSFIKLQHPSRGEKSEISFIYEGLIKENLNNQKFEINHKD